MERIESSEFASRGLPSAVILTIEDAHGRGIHQQLNKDTGIWEIGEFSFDYFQIDFKWTKGFQGSEVLMVLDRGTSTIYHFPRASLRPQWLDSELEARLKKAESGFSSKAIACYTGKKFPMPMI